MKELFNNHWFQFGSVQVLFWSALGFPGVASILYFTWFMLWVWYGKKEPIWN
jgi:hypothetical protein